MLTEKFFISSERLEKFYEIFRKDVTYDNIKSHKNQGFTLSLEDTFLKKSTGGGSQTDPLPPAVLELKFKILMTSS